MRKSLFSRIATNERFFEILEAQKPVGVSCWYLGSEIEFWISPGLLKALGYVPGGMVVSKLSGLAIIAPQDREPFQKMLAEMPESKQGFSIEFDLVDAGGKRMHFRNTAFRIPDPEGSQPITAILHHAPEEAKNLPGNATNQSSKLSEMLALQGETVVVLDQQFIIKELYTNGLDSELDPLTDGKKGKHLSALGLSDEVVLRLVAAADDTRSEGTKTEIEYRTEDAAGFQFYSASVSSIKPGHNHGGETILVIDNITAKKYADTQLLEMSSLAAKTHDITLLTDASGKITWVNDAFVRLTKTGSEEARGKSPQYFLCGPETNKKTLLLIAEALEHCQAIQTEVTNHVPGGEKYWLDLRIDPVFNEVGHCTHFVCVGRNITQRKLWEDELLATRQFLQQTSRVANIGGWSYEVASDKVRWTEVMYDLHELDYDFVPTVEAVINYYEEGESRQRYFEAGMNAIQFGTSYDIELYIITAKGNRVKVRAVGNAEMEDGQCKKLYGTFQRVL